MSRLGRFLLGCLVLVLTVACPSGPPASNDDTGPQEPTIQLGGDGLAPLVFPVQPVPDGERFVMEALFEGRLVLGNGCLRLDTGHEDPLVVWPPGFTYVDGAVLDAAGEVVARPGQTVRMGGGEVPTIGDVEWNGPGPEACDGPYFVVGEGIEVVEG